VMAVRRTSPGTEGALLEEKQESSPAGLPVQELDPEEFRRNLSAWYRQHARKLPWRGVHDPYATWLSEIMLQQTRVATVIDRYTAFLEKFPTIAALSEAKEADVLALWSGLGYYRRARMLHRGAQFVMQQLQGKLPRTSNDLRTLPGIGEYTAAAIASIAFGESIAVVDGNVERVILRILGLPEDTTAATATRVRQAAKLLVPDASPARSRTNPPGNHNQAMMELGATICLPRQPLCLQCPVMPFCATRGEHVTPKRQKQKSRVVAYLLALRKRGTATEVLLERRPAEASLMPLMLELPPLPVDVAEDREPVLRLRHAITNTNYYVQVFSQAVAGPPGEPQHETLHDALNEADDPHAARKQSMLEEVVFEHETDDPNSPSLLKFIPAAMEDLRWVPAIKLHELPLTGLARKALQRLGLMRMPSVRLR
jgi:A/G-specific adenine glycosylase